VAPIYIASLGVKALSVGLERGEFVKAREMVKVKVDSVGFGLKPVLFVRKDKAFECHIASITHYNFRTITALNLQPHVSSNE